MNIANNKGFTLIELMLGLTIGLIATGGVVSMLSHSIQSNSVILKDIYLNQELRTIMSGIVKDIRRAGYWKNANGLSENPFSAIYISKDKSCILYNYDIEPYDKNRPGKEDNFGIRLIDQAIRIRENSTDCTTKKGWRSVTDNNNLKIESLIFNDNSLCTNISSTQRDCNTPEIGDVLSIKHIIDVSISAYLKNDKNNLLNLNERIVVRNSVSQFVNGS